ncbi:MAG: hypothetical protein GF401_01640 [Chitinivibrionales bacterium]|nr:hypothetical protein [Chitinivibrionales bacterium]
MTSSTKPEALQTAGKRLEDSHFLWHQCASSYWNLDVFHIQLNSCIQSLRSVTFMLQKQKSGFPSFDVWYERWRTAMKGDEILSWLVESCNHIEKEGDLVVNSQFKVSILVDYKDTGFESFIVPPSTTSTEILEELRKRDLPKTLTKFGFYRIEKRWISATLPDHELLNALAYCYGVLKYLLIDAQSFLTIEDESESEEFISQTAKRRDERPDCMVDNNWDRSQLFKIATGEDVISFSEPAPEISDQEILDRYPFLKDEKFNVQQEGFFEVCDTLFQKARLICAKDGGHVTIVMLLKDGAPGKIINLQPETRSDKWILWSQVAAEVKRVQVDYVICISEIWTAPYDPDNPNRHAVDAPDRKEALSLSAVSFADEQYHIFCLLERKGKRISLGKTIYVKEKNSHIFDPIRKVWQQRRLGNAFKPFKLASRSPCLCHSGKKYKLCCRRYVEDKSYERATDLHRTGKYRQAERAYRAWLTQYTMWYNEHTVHFAAGRPKDAEKWIEMERKALLEICCNLANSMLMQGKLDEAIDMLNKSSAIMEDEKFKNQMIETAKTLAKQVSEWKLSNCGKNDSEQANGGALTTYNSAKAEIASQLHM